MNLEHITNFGDNRGFKSMYETLICPKCNKDYTNVGAIPQLCFTCWIKYNAELNKLYPNRKIHVFDY